MKGGNEDHGVSLLQGCVQCLAAAASWVSGFDAGPSAAVLAAHVHLSSQSTSLISTRMPGLLHEVNLWYAYKRRQEEKKKITKPPSQLG